MLISGTRLEGEISSVKKEECALKHDDVKHKYSQIVLLCYGIEIKRRANGDLRIEPREKSSSFEFIISHMSLYFQSNSSETK